MNPSSKKELEVSEVMIGHQAYQMVFVIDVFTRMLVGQKLFPKAIQTSKPQKND